MSLLSTRYCLISSLCRRRAVRIVGDCGRTIRTTTTRSATTSLSHDILLRDDDSESGVSTLTLNRPKQYNTLTSHLLDSLRDELECIRHDDSVRVVVIKSSSPKCFSSGHDLKELLHSSTDEIDVLFKKCSGVMTFLTRHLPQPVIVQVNGLCTAAGTQLVASCDLAVCSVDAKFGVNGIDVGLFCSTPAVALARNIPRKHAMKMLLTGDFISSEQALDFGLVNQVVPVEELEHTTMEMARRISSKSPFAIQLGKEAFYKQLDMQSLDEAYEFAGEQICRNMDSHDAEEGISAFLEKRTPEWKGN